LLQDRQCLELQRIQLKGVLFLYHVMRVSNLRACFNRRKIIPEREISFQSVCR
jgi:hypothetical protein